MFGHSNDLVPWNDKSDLLGAVLQHFWKSNGITLYLAASSKAADYSTFIFDSFQI